MALAWTAAASVQAPAPAPRPEPLQALDAVALDDPRAALALAQRELAATTDPERRFWLRLGLVRAHAQLEQVDKARAAVQAARDELDAWPAATPQHQLWLQVVALNATWTDASPQVAQARLRELMQQPAARDDAVLSCEARELDMTLLIDIESLDEAWLAAEALERCGQALGRPGLASSGISAMGLVASRGAGARPISPEPYFERAAEVLGHQPARMRRSIIAWDRGGALKREGRLDAALQHLAVAHHLSTALDDAAGMAAASIEMAAVHLMRRQPEAALALLRDARQRLEGQDNGFRLQRVSQYTVEALTQQRRPEVLAAINQARRFDTASLPPGERARLARVLAAGYASQGHYAEAYAEAERAEGLGREGRATARDAQILRLQARYANAQRDAENAELRHRSEAARLALVAEIATQRALWGAVAALAVLLLGGALWGRHVLARRRSLAVLALRDELTGQPNRRAVSAYAQAQFEQAQRLGVPMSVALIDLDHFKRVNDTLGHAAGDAVLCALAGAARQVLRGQDRLGRWGGEEWLLVMPGSSVQELPMVFERLRARFAANPGHRRGRPAPVHLLDGRRRSRPADAVARRPDRRMRPPALPRQGRRPQHPALQRLTPARSSMACSSTLQPAVMCSALASSISLWLMPSLQGMKIMPAGASLAM